MGTILGRLLPLLLVFVSSGQIRYKDISFNEISSSPDILYRIAPDYLSQSDSLFMDMYEPKGDTTTNRPAIMLLYGGSFVSGSRKDSLIVAFSNYFAHCGYVVFAIDYRIGVDASAAIPLLEVPKAMYRAIQDSKAAARFIRKNAQNFKIDPARVFALGYSAGAITLIHHAYVNEAEAAQNQLLKLAASSLGELESGENLEISSKIDCVINCSGAIADTTWIESDESPILSFHGTDDNVVPCIAGYIGGESSGIILFGSAVIHKVAKSIGLTNKVYLFEGADHSLKGYPRDTIPVATTNFLYNLMNPISIKFNNISHHNNRIRPKDVNPQYFDVVGRSIINKRTTASTLIIKDKDGVRQVIRLKPNFKIN